MYVYIKLRQWKRISQLVLALTLVGLSIGSQKLGGIIAQAQSNQATVAVLSLPLYGTPADPSTEIAQLAQGDTFTIDGRNTPSAWLHGRADGHSGWVETAYLQLPDGFSFANIPILGKPSGGGSGSSGGSSGSSNPAPVASGGAGRGFALGGQATSLNGNAVNAMHSAGMTWVKFQAQSGDGGALGDIDSAHAQGFHILLSVIGDKGSITNDGYQNSYAGYVASLAAHGADAIEIWNEENLDREWPAGQINPALYVQLLAKSYNAIKSANRSTMVISGAPSPTGAEGAFGLDHVWNDNHYYAGMANAGAASYLDCVGAHYNEGIVSPTQTSGDPRDNYPTRYFWTMLARAGNPFGKPVCFTELGYLTPEGYGGLPGSFGWAANTTVAEQALWLSQAVAQAVSSGEVRLIIVFNVDFTTYGADPQAGYAMIRPGGSCPACATLGRMMGVH